MQPPEDPSLDIARARAVSDGQSHIQAFKEREGLRTVLDEIHCLFTSPPLLEGGITVTVNVCRARA